MRNKWLFGLLTVLLSLLLLGCKAENQATLSKEEHRNIFFPSLNAQTILDYQFTYRVERGAFITLARVTMSTNAFYSVLQKRFPKMIRIDQAPEQGVYFELLRSRAASLVGGTNNVPIWFSPKKESTYDYMDRIDSSTEERIWWDSREDTIYFIATGKGDVTPPRNSVPKA
jgi:hypothetical protein